ncbi:MAG: hypothetical protein R3E12_20050 [Candidatus Eisenbacteria bacterium]
MHYSRWFMMGGASTDDVFQVYVSNDGGASWASLESVATFDPSWHEVVYRVDDVVTLTDQIQFKWVACDNNTRA